MFTRNEYKDILLDSLRYCQQEKGMEIYAWCVMTNHVHLILSSIKNEKPELILGSFKRFTSNAIGCHKRKSSGKQKGMATEAI
ncbi:MAG: transposase [Paludibacter sp.]